jgi:hypothetical protein
MRLRSQVPSRASGRRSQAPSREDARGGTVFPANGAEHQVCRPIDPPCLDCSTVRGSGPRRRREITLPTWCRRYCAQFLQRTSGSARQRFVVGTNQVAPHCENARGFGDAGMNVHPEGGQFRRRKVLDVHRCATRLNHAIAPKQSRDMQHRRAERFTDEVARLVDGDVVRGCAMAFRTKIHLNPFCATCPPTSATSDLSVDCRIA